MDLLQLRYFRVVARVEHMTKAAQELFIAQPSLSKTIRRLEKEIGVPLFDQQGRTIRLNQFGKAFLEHIERLFRELEEGQREVRDMAGLEQGEVSLVTASLYWLPSCPSLRSPQILSGSPPRSTGWKERKANILPLAFLAPVCYHLSGG